MNPRRGPRVPRLLLSLLWGIALVALGMAELRAQEGSARILRVVQADGQTTRVELVAHRGHAALPVSELEVLGWEAGPDPDGPDGAWILRPTAASPVTAEVRVEPDDPLFTWDGEVFQLVGTPYHQGGELWIPAQLVVDFFPDRLREHYRARSSPREGVPVVERLSAWSGEAVPGASAPFRTPRVPGDEPAARPGGRVVVIDPGHGGRDPGAVGPRGTREKDVALALGLTLARELERHPGLEVHLTRESDILVPLWNRGEWATQVKGDRPGIFVSLHANAVPSRSGVRGFETYFLNEARTEHEARVAANENAPLALEREATPGAAELPELDFILRDLRNNDHAHWSEELAGMIQDRLAPVHPGPDRGVKQGPLAVITNALMPSVLVEVGFLSHPDEEQLLTRSEFHSQVAEALGQAVVDFFRRYPSEQGVDVTAVADDRASDARGR